MKADKRLTISLYNGVSEPEGLRFLAQWFEEHQADSKAHPMVGAYVGKTIAAVNTGKNKTSFAIEAVTKREKTIHDK